VASFNVISLQWTEKTEEKNMNLSGTTVTLTLI